jgi:hypothetical protein
MTTDRTLPVTPAERACATVLRAWLAWEPDGDADHNYCAHMVMLDLSESLLKNGLVAGVKPTPAGRDLLARAEAATPAEPATAIVAFLRAEEARFRRNSKDPAHDAAGRERCTNKASVLATVAAYIERGDHLTTSIDAPRVEAAERTPETVLRAMLRAYEDEWLDLETKLRCYVRGEGPLTLADRHNLEAFRETVPALRGITAEVLSGSPFDPGQTFGRYAPTAIGADYAARLAGTTPLDAPPRRAP